MNEEDKIKEILASLDPQLQVDAIRIVEQSNTDDKERKVKFLQRTFASRKKDNYPKDEKKLQEDRGKYTESFRNAIEEEKIKKNAEKERIRKIINAYEKTSVKEEDINRLYEIYETKISIQTEKSETEKRRTFLMIIKEFFSGKEKREKEQKQDQGQEKQREIKTNSREQFAEGLKPKYIIKSDVQVKKQIGEKQKGLEK